jgi:hypothetical protein
MFQMCGPLMISASRRPFVASGAVTERHGVTPGTAGNGFRSANRAAIAGGTTPVCIVATYGVDDWSPASEACHFSEWGSPNSSWACSSRTTTNGQRFYSSTDGTTALSNNVTGLISLTDGTSNLYTLRWLLTPNNGASQTNVKIDQWSGSSWTSLKNVNIAGATTVFVSSANLHIGGFGPSLTGPTNGIFKRVRLYNTDENGTLIADFNPNDYSGSGTTWVSSTTGETWTIVGTATVVLD